MARLFIALMQIIPKNLLSYICGLVVRFQLPDTVQRLVNRLFVQLFGIDMGEAEFPLSRYRTIEDVFIRKLAPGLRPIAGDVVFPCDGTLSVSAPFHDGGKHLLQAKGLVYELTEFLDCEASEVGETGWQQTIYLAPHNYHRVHAPVGGKVRRVVYIPGQLWPVNKLLVDHLPNLFCENERLVFEIESSRGGMVYVVMVGALNVGRISSQFLPNFVTNAKISPGRRKVFTLDSSVELHAGDELGVFMLGSTVVTIFDQRFCRDFAFDQSSNTLVKMGEMAGRSSPPKKRSQNSRRKSVND